MSTLIIISGGQTGVDRAALDAAIEQGFVHSGYCPAGRRAEDGNIPLHYQLIETCSKAYPERTRKNVMDSDGTLVIFKNKPTAGTALTLDMLNQCKKPYFTINLDESYELGEIIYWISDNKIQRLNVAGPRESTTPGIYQEAKQIIADLLKQLAINAR